VLVHGLRPSCPSHLPRPPPRFLTPPTLICPSPIPLGPANCEPDLVLRRSVPYLKHIGPQHRPKPFPSLGFVVLLISYLRRHRRHFQPACACRGPEGSYPTWSCSHLVRHHFPTAAAAVAPARSQRYYPRPFARVALCVPGLRHCIRCSCAQPSRPAIVWRRHPVSAFPLFNLTSAGAQPALHQNLWSVIRLELSTNKQPRLQPDGIRLTLPSPPEPRAASQYLLSPRSSPR
jgi:hypothetical protein